MEERGQVPRLSGAVQKPARTGGRQVAKARLQRQAAEHGIDVQCWRGVREERRQAARLLEQAMGGGDGWARVLEERLEPQRERWRRQEAARAVIGDEGAEERFRDAARAAGVSVLDEME